MQDKMLKACFLVSLFGILLLLFLSEVMQPPITEISSINKKILGKSLSLIGSVASEKNIGDFRVLELCGNSSACISVILNSKDKNNFTGRNMVVVGKLAEYKNELQIEADKIIEAGKQNAN